MQNDLYVDICMSNSANYCILNVISGSMLMILKRKIYRRTKAVAQSGTYSFCMLC